ncbi:MAG: CAP domain-containing protein [Acidobacteria bacterium]|nr:CAP domain-containing protein [Acidobacteriota bacterium]
MPEHARAGLARSPNAILVSRRRWLGAVVAVAASVARIEGPQASSPASDETRLRDLINESRRARGLAPLAASLALDEDARAHSTKLARRQDLFHRSSREFRRLKVAWIRVGENVGTAGDVDEMHRLMLASPLHRANVLGDFTAVGIGIERDRRGRLWVTELFVAQ